MKTLLAAILFFAPFGANAATSLGCTAGGLGVDIAIKIERDPAPLDRGSVLKITADGILHSEFTALVEDLTIPESGVAVVDFVTLNRQGKFDLDSGVATLTLAIQGDDEGVLHANGSGKIHVARMPKREGMLRLQRDYLLNDCQGRL